MITKLKNYKQMHETYKVSNSFLWKLRKNSPDFSERVVRKVAGKIFYDTEEFEKWLGEQKEVKK